MKYISSQKIVLAALLAALTMVATMFIRIPLPLGYVNLGDAFVLLSVFILGPIYGTVAAGLGSAIADLVGYISYAPGTLIIKSLMALVAYFLYKLLLTTTKKSLLAEIVGGVAAAIVMAFGYFAYETMFFETAATAILNVPFNLLQGAVGVALSVAVMRVLISTKVLDKLTQTRKKGMKQEIPYKIYLEESELPTKWLNLRAFMDKKPAPLLNPQTHQPMTEEELSKIFCKELARQEIDDTSLYIDIPSEVRDFYKMYRPAPLVRAYCLEKALQTPAKIYYKFEGNNTSGSHKLNSAIAQAYYAKEQGLKGVTTETGAGQWGTALSMACSYFGLDCKVFMVKVSYEQKPFRREVMRTYGANVTPSPSMTTEVGRKILEEHPGTGGSLGCAISEAVETACGLDGYRYALGSVLNQVLLHQSVIGLEAKAALDKYGVKPDVIIGCAGGGSNLGGLIAPFMAEKLQGKADYQFIAVEPASCPSLTRGAYAYDYCDTGKVCPLSKMYTLGSGFMPSANHAGGLRYHGMTSTLSELRHQGLMEARSVEQTSVFAAAEQFARVEGILPAPESAHAIRVAIDEAMKCKETGEEKTILFGLTGTGYFDMFAYEKFHDGKMSDYIPSDEEIQKSLANLPKI